MRSEEVSLLDRPDLHFTRGPFGNSTSGSARRPHLLARPRWVPMLDGLDLVLRWFLDELELVNTMDSKVVAAAFGMDPEATLIHLADHVDEVRLPDR
ncbi:hypothetical protein ACFCXK_03395 [Streptomyces sp. NPDC056269]|uniref:hypothetical protein n=1 Tax=Streptomyces sp. NPDC056269 TaxID=3345768 RepID=UPI0035D5F689